MGKLFWFAVGAGATYWVLDKLGMLKDWPLSVEQRGAPPVQTSIDAPKKKPMTSPRSAASAGSSKAN